MRLPQSSFSSAKASSAAASKAQGSQSQAEAATLQVFCNRSTHRFHFCTGKLATSTCMSFLDALGYLSSTWASERISISAENRHSQSLQALPLMWEHTLGSWANSEGSCRSSYSPKVFSTIYQIAIQNCFCTVQRSLRPSQPLKSTYNKHVKQRSKNNSSQFSLPNIGLLVIANTLWQGRNPWEFQILGGCITWIAKMLGNWPRMLSYTQYATLYFQLRVLQKTGVQ